MHPGAKADKGPFFSDPFGRCIPLSFFMTPERSRFCRIIPDAGHDYSIFFFIK
jgi:hypothetical protein